MDLPFDGAISTFYKAEAPDDLRKAVEQHKTRDILSDAYPYQKRMKKSEYEETLAALQLELAKLQRDVIETGKRIVVVFEGRDASGKGGTIKRFRENLNPRDRPGRGAFQAHRPRGGRMVFPALCLPSSHRGRDRVLRPQLVQPRRRRGCLRLLHQRRAGAVLSPAAGVRDALDRRRRPFREDLAVGQPARAASPVSSA